MIQFPPGQHRIFSFFIRAYPWKSTILLAMAISANFLSMRNSFAAELPLANPGFENGLSGWTAKEDEPMTDVIADAAQTGNLGLRVSDSSNEFGSSLLSERYAVSPGEKLKLTFSAKMISGEGVEVYLRFSDVSKKLLNSQESANEIIMNIENRLVEWTPLVLEAEAPPEAVWVDVWIHSYVKYNVVCNFDNFDLKKLSNE